MKKTALIAFCVFGFGTCFSQSLTPEVLPTSGDNFVGTNASLSWTLGEGVIETFNSNNLILTQGFQQSNLLITLLSKNIKADVNVSLFPNPTNDWLNIEIKDANEKKYDLQLYDIKGTLIESISLKNPVSKINIEDYKPGVYTLKLSMQGTGKTNVYKVIKN